MKTTIEEFEETLKSKDLDGASNPPALPTRKETQKTPPKVRQRPRKFAGNKTRDRRKELQQIAASVSRGLSDAHEGFIYLPQEDAELLKAAFDHFFSGKAKSLDLAFGVKRGRGAPKRGPSPSVLERTMKVNALRWTRTFEELEEETGVGRRTLQRAQVRHSNYAAKELAKKLTRDKK